MTYPVVERAAAHGFPDTPMVYARPRDRKDMQEAVPMITAANPPTEAILDHLLETLRFDHDGLIPAIAQDDESGDVLMMAYMSQESYQETLKTGRVCY